MLPREAGLQQSFDPGQSLEDHLVAGVELDARFSVDAFHIKISAEVTPRPGAVASRLPQAADLALPYSKQLSKGRRREDTHCDCGPPSAVFGPVRVRGPFLAH